MTSSEHLVVIGCGAAKAAVDEAIPAQELYTSTYFEFIHGRSHDRVAGY